MKNTKHATTNYKALKPFIEVADKNDGYAKFTAAGYMDLVIENLYYTDFEGNPVYSMSHYGEQNGDLMCDPDMTFSINDKTGSIRPMSFQNDYMGLYQRVFKTQNGKTLYNPRLLADLDSFLWQWWQNIINQGFKPEVTAA